MRIKRKKTFWLVSFTILLYPIFVINYLFIGFLFVKSIFKKQMKFVETLKEGVILLIPIFLQVIFNTF